MLELRNHRPTEAEKQLYFYAGYYLYDDSNQDTVKYAVCYTKESDRREFPLELKIEEETADLESGIIFDNLSESVKISGYVDVLLLELIGDRIKELGWIRNRRTFTSSSNDKKIFSFEELKELSCVAKYKKGNNLTKNKNLNEKEKEK